MNTSLDLSTDEALLSSITEHKLGNLKLEPYSLVRQSVAFDLIDRGSGTYFAAVMTCYVCTLSEDDALLAHANLLEAKKKAFQWAEANGYGWHNWRPLVDEYLRLDREWSAVIKARVQPPENLGNGQQEDELPNAGGQPAFSKSPAL